MSEALEARLERLEIIEAVRSTFHEYTHFLDGGFLDELVNLFTPDCEMTTNYPPASGKELFLRGHAEIRALWETLKFGSFRHHVMNSTVAVANDRRSAELSSYFMTASPYQLAGGLYQGTFVPAGNDWRIRVWRVASTWGWRIDDPTNPPYLAERLGAYALRDGKPVAFRP